MSGGLATFLLAGLLWALAVSFPALLLLTTLYILLTDSGEWQPVLRGALVGWLLALAANSAWVVAARVPYAVSLSISVPALFLATLAGAAVGWAWVRRNAVRAGQV